MRRGLFTLFFLLSLVGGTLNAQSKKQLNVQLSNQIIIEKARYDSLTMVYNNALSALTTARSLAGTSLYKGLGAINYSIEEKRYELKKELATYRLIRLEEAEAIEVYNEKLTNYYTLKSDLEMLFDFKYKEIEKITPLYLGNTKKIVERNTMMTKQIALYQQGSEDLKSATNAILENKAKLNAFNSKSDELIIEYDAELRRLKGLIITVNQQVNAAKQEFSDKGPKGFDEAYFMAFPNVFPEKMTGVAASEKQTNKVNISLGTDENDIPPAMSEPSCTLKITGEVNSPAEYPGGRDSLVAFLSSNIHYPEFAFNNRIGGKCYVKFVISETGHISNVKVQRGVLDCRECDEEAIRVVKLMPDWIPGTTNGKPVNQWYTLPIVFKTPVKK